MQLKAIIKTNHMEEFEQLADPDLLANIDRLYLLFYVEKATPTGMANMLEFINRMALTEQETERPIELNLYYPNTLTYGLLLPLPVADSICFPKGCYLPKNDDKQRNMLISCTSVLSDAVPSIRTHADQYLLTYTLFDNLPDLLEFIKHSEVTAYREKSAGDIIALFEDHIDPAYTSIDADIYRAQIESMLTPNNKD